MDSVDVVCPQCQTKIHIPFFRDLEELAIEEYDLAETNAQEELGGLMSWLESVSLFGLIKFWLKR